MILSRLLSVSIALLFLGLTTRCGKKESVVAPNIAALVGTWQLIEPDSTNGVTLQFAYDSRNPPQDITPFNVSGRAAVNGYTLRLFATLDGTMSADNLGYTDMAGSPQAMQFEQTYFASLNAVARFDLPTSGRLRLYHGGSQPGVLTYKKVN
ncbi:META domain-containing protein [Spirosoma validum]|uniref:META domain-containing protein n=1 Tax=Spirosoma validum TaxID=2771355 RepID=A0A927GC16_9BACT|nr:META domain-containing protein [Spirosoma validum]MBD2752183.1 META domain-containing protein [Spirosoma validum]